MMAKKTLLYIIILLVVVGCFSNFINITKVEIDCVKCTGQNNVFVKVLYFGHFLTHITYECKTSLMEISKYGIINDVICQNNSCTNFFNR